MSNRVSINISAMDGNHEIVLQQAVKFSRTIESSLDGKPHAITECSANGDGTVLNGNTHIFIFNDAVSVTIDPTANAVAMSIPQASVRYSGALAPGQVAALVAFVKSCGLPDLAA